MKYVNGEVRSDRGRKVLSKTVEDLRQQCTKSGTPPCKYVCVYVCMSVCPYVRTSECFMSV